MLNRRFPIHRSDDTYNQEKYAAATCLLQEMAAEDPSAQAFLDAWNEGTTMIEQWEREADARCERGELSTSKRRKTCERLSQ